MQSLRQGIDIDAFFEELSTASGRVLLLDYDGTLAPFRTERGAAVPYREVPGILEGIIANANCRTVIISGRAIADLIPLAGLKRVPEIWGCHGWERRLADGTYVAPQLPDGPAAGLREAGEWAEDAGIGERLERKPVTVALHWRGMAAGEIECLRNKIAESWGTIAAEHGLQVHDFNGGLELRLPGRDKGFAVNSILEEAAADSVAAYLGDDLTDEDAFIALRGRGLSVLVNERLRDTAADVWIKPPEELLDFLRRWSEAIGGKNV